MRDHGPGLRRRLPALRPPLAGLELVAVSLTLEGEGAAMWARPADRAALLGRQEGSGGASFPAERVDPGVEVWVSVQARDGGTTFEAVIADLTLAHPRLAVQSDGTVAIASARCSWRAGSIRLNAATYSPNGSLVSRGLLGDGIASLDCAADGGFWVGYVDEGIFGNLGWQPPGPGPMGSSGLVRCTRSFDVVWSYPTETVGPIDDSPYLNLVGDAVWLTYDSGYPVARIVDGGVSIFSNGTGSAFAVLVDGSTVALLSRDATLGRIDGGGFVPFALAALDLPGRPLRGVARGAEYHSFGADGSWTTVALPDLLEASVQL